MIFPGCTRTRFHRTAQRLPRELDKPSSVIRYCDSVSMKNLTTGDPARIRSRQDISRVMLTWRPKRGKTHQRVVSWQSPAIAVPGCDADEAKLRRHTSASRYCFCRSGGSRKQTVQEANFNRIPAYSCRGHSHDANSTPRETVPEAVRRKPCRSCTL